VKADINTFQRGTGNGQYFMDKQSSFKKISAIRKGRLTGVCCN